MKLLMMCRHAIIAFSLITHIAYASEGSSDAAVKEAIGRDMQKLFALYIKTGEILVYTKEGMSLQTPDALKGHFSPDYFKEFMHLHRLKLLEIVSPHGGPGTYEVYNVEITELGRKIISRLDIADHLRANGFYAFKSGQYRVTDIIKNDEHKNENLPKSESYRYIVGKYDYIPNNLGLAYHKERGDVLKPSYKFRAIVRHDPFTGKYTAINADWGFLDREKWETNSVK